MDDTDDIEKKNLLRMAVFNLCTAAHPRPMAPTEIIRLLRDEASEREVRAAIQHHVQTGMLAFDIDLKLNVGRHIEVVKPGELRPPNPEEQLRELCVEPRDLDEHPWVALMDALYQKYGAGAEAYDFAEFCKQHEAWFAVAARIYMQGRAGAVSPEEFAETLRAAALPPNHPERGE